MAMKLGPPARVGHSARTGRRDFLEHLPAKVRLGRDAASIGIGREVPASSAKSSPMALGWR
jgi:hypothetical protein